MSRHHDVFAISLNIEAPAIIQNIHGTTEALIWRRSNRSAASKKAQNNALPSVRTLLKCISANTNRNNCNKWLVSSEQRYFWKLPLWRSRWRSGTRKQHQRTALTLPKRSCRTHTQLLLAFLKLLLFCLQTNLNSTPCTPRSTEGFPVYFVLPMQITPWRIWKEKIRSRLIKQLSWIDNMFFV